MLRYGPCPSCDCLELPLVRPSIATTFCVVRSVPIRIACTSTPLVWPSSFGWSTRQGRGQFRQGRDVQERGRVLSHHSPWRWTSRALGLWGRHCPSSTQLSPLLLGLFFGLFLSSDVDPIWHQGTPFLPLLLSSIESWEACGHSSMLSLSCWCLEWPTPPFQIHSLYVSFPWLRLLCSLLELYQAHSLDYHQSFNQSKHVCWQVLDALSDPCFQSCHLCLDGQNQSW